MPVRGQSNSKPIKERVGVPSGSALGGNSLVDNRRVDQNIVTLQSLSVPARYSAPASSGLNRIYIRPLLHRGSDSDSADLG